MRVICSEKNVLRRVPVQLRPRKVHPFGLISTFVRVLTISNRKGTRLLVLRARIGACSRQVDVTTPIVTRRYCVAFLEGIVALITSISCPYSCRAGVASIPLQMKERGRVDATTQLLDSAQLTGKPCTLYSIYAFIDQHCSFYIHDSCVSGPNVHQTSSRRVSRETRIISVIWWHILVRKCYYCQYSCIDRWNRCNIAYFSCSLQGYPRISFTVAPKVNLPRINVSIDVTSQTWVSTKHCEG